MKGEGDVTVGARRIQIASIQQNPLLLCLTDLEGDILVRMKINCDPGAPNVICHHHGRHAAEGDGLVRQLPAFQLPAHRVRCPRPVDCSQRMEIQLDDERRGGFQTE